jgi:hypothetical protein
MLLIVWMDFTAITVCVDADLGTIKDEAPKI